MTNPSAAVTVLDHYPTEDEVAKLTEEYLKEFPAEWAQATSEIVRKAPPFMCTSEQDQINAHIRDGGPRTYVLVVYMEEAEPWDEDEDDDEYGNVNDTE